MKRFQPGEEIAVGGHLLTVLAEGDLEQTFRGLARRMAHAVEDGKRGGELSPPTPLLTPDNAYIAAQLWKARRSFGGIARRLKTTPLQVARTLNERGLIAGAPVMRLSKADHSRLLQMEQRNRRRAAERGVEVEPVDFIAILDAQDWRCAITGRRLDPSLRGPHPNSISLDHRVGIAFGGGHTARNVQGTLLRENLLKGNKVETKGAGKIRRLRGETGPKARQARRKAAGTYVPIPSRPLQSGAALQSRGFDKTFKRTIPSKSHPSRTVRR